MYDHEAPSGAILSKQLFLGFMLQYGMHPATLPWSFINVSTEEMIKHFGGDTDEVYPEELPAEPE